nr:RNA-directed DNA polymerase, eukaryota [Tanacetum cinerariifolium]
MGIVNTKEFVKRLANIWIDHFILSESIINENRDLTTTVFERGKSDHNPIFLHIEKLDYGPYPFKFFHSWLKRPDFDIMIKKVIEDSSTITTTPGSRLKDKDAALEEIKNAVCDCISSKAPGQMPVGSNSTFIILIPKGGDNVQRKMGWIKWDLVLASKAHRGLGVGSLKSFNLALLQKRRWRPIEGGRIGGMLAAMMEDIGHIDLTFELDTWQWLIGKDGVFTAGETHKHIDDVILLVMDSSTRWNKFLPRKISVFMWKLSLDHLPHRFSLSICGFDIDSILCPICLKTIETKDNIFSTCKVAFWMLIRGWCGLSNSNMNSIASWLEWIDGLAGASIKNDRMHVIVATTSLYIWKF